MRKALLIKQFSFLFLLSTIGSMWLTSCKKKADEEPYYRLPAEGLSFIKPRQGQYFIYKDSVSGTLDSVVVTESKLEKLHSDGSGQLKSSNYYDNYSLTLTKYTATGSSVWLKGNARASFSDTDFTFFSSKAVIMDWDSYIFRYPAASYGGIFPNDRSIPSLVVGGKQYTNVYLTTGIHSTDSKFYWAKGVGLVRYERGGPAPQTFNLLRSN